MREYKKGLKWKSSLLAQLVILSTTKIIYFLTSDQFFKDY